MSASYGGAAGGPARILITGGAGFVGANLAQHLLMNGIKVRILDSLVRAGSEENIRWLVDLFPQRIEFVQADVRDRDAVRAALNGIDHVFHLAAQVAVTTSLAQPRMDFEINTQGTLNLLEAARPCARPPSIAFSSTNKVYGVLSDIEVRAAATRYVPVDEHVRACGIGESRALDFHSPYGCSKGAAEQYVLDYARSFGLRTIVLRMSCIYGPHQHGNEDQGWVTHLVRRAIADERITVYGDGLQVRDILFVEDLVDAFERAWLHVTSLSGRAFNVGGGVSNTVSILELLRHIERLIGRKIRIGFDDWRIGDQRYYVSDISRFRNATGWRPRTGVNTGLAVLCDWFDAFQPGRAGPGARRSRGSFVAPGARP